jgi:hypothetical protein
MGSSVVVPKQRVIKKFHPRHEMNVAAYVRLERHYDLKQLGIEFIPVSDRYWEYDEHTAYRINYLDLDYIFLGDDPTPQHDDWIVLPEKAELVVKEDITIERMLDALIVGGDEDRGNDEPWFVPNVRSDDGFYHFKWLFKNVMSEQRLKKELIQKLDDPALLSLSKTISFPVFDEDTDEEIRFEVTITPYGKWQFARIVAIRYDNSRFEHCLKKSSNRNVYKPGSKSIELLKNNLLAFSDSKSSDEWLAERLICNFLVAPNVQTLLNQEIALRLQADHFWVNSFAKDLEAVAEFEVFEIDYTTFIE